jgi:dTDP-3-amino-3,4,6-trideoxy-alpha-D-glucose transaminase
VARLIANGEASATRVSSQGAIRFLDLRRRMRILAPQLQEAIGRVLDSGRLLDGPELDGFEREWAAYTGRRFAVGVASGTDALSLALAALDVGAGDEVIVPAFTAVPTFAAVCRTGATPVAADVDRETAGLDPEAAAAAVTPRTRAVIVVHLYGRPMPLPDLGLPVIEDAAQAHGAVRGSGGLAAAYSFYPTKNLGGIGDGGAVVTDDEGLARRVARLRAHGRSGDSHDEIAGNSRLSELEAAALRVALPSLESGNARRAEIAAAYRDAAPSLRWQREHHAHAHHLCVTRVEEREAFRARMPFETAIHYPRAVTDEPAYRRFGRSDLPEARAWASECVSLPCNPELTREEVDRVCAALA